ncbi:hypothetical protein HRG84_03945 [Flavisolibacter sp. BT320]|nr:hypothetical protein [Flavisolibacter longurius]
MFQLIIGILLGVLLLFVIILLITEVATTYPVWKQAGREAAFGDEPLNGRGRRSPVRIFLLILVALIGLSMAVYLVGTRLLEPGETVAKNQAASNTSEEPVLHAKVLTASYAGRQVHFRLQTKWEDGKLYGNNNISFQSDSVWRFTDCRYHLLDKEGFLVKEIIFVPDDFIYITTPEGKTNGVSSKFNTEISLREYRKIEKLQVVLDKKMVPVLL